MKIFNFCEHKIQKCDIISPLVMIIISAVNGINGMNNFIHLTVDKD
ncbi:hypothetical protein [[Clostridium] aminophilum]|nr:hypothetical protein [[Clostridium] aminophilum]